ncbi:MAG TPA: PASTA domain-containing protein [Chitinispirillaceae bacterium]|nr:PASTA domain-containing protein [Chitinispirillaceae bacterium]
MKKNYTISIPVKTFWKIVVPSFIVACILGSVFGFFFIDKIVMPKIVGVSRDIIEVPGLSGLSYETARQKLYESGLLTEIRSREFDSNVPEDGVISQSPEKGEKVKKGRKIAVVLSKGKEVAVIPDVRGLSERQARIEMKKSGFTIGKVKKTFSESVPSESVIDAFPQSGTTVSRALEVDLIVSKGVKPTHTEVPNMVGESITSAKEKLAESNLNVGKISYENNASLLPGTVISQSAAPGSRQPLESSVDLVVSVIRK